MERTLLSDLLRLRAFILLIPTEEGGYTIGCPSIPGCWSQGETELEALLNIADAMQLMLDVQRECNSA
jgi:predicted RNase H-like HicB family nuclease